MLLLMLVLFVLTWLLHSRGVMLSFIKDRFNARHVYSYMYMLHLYLIAWSESTSFTDIDCSLIQMPSVTMPAFMFTHNPLRSWLYLTAYMRESQQNLHNRISCHYCHAPGCTTVDGTDLCTNLVCHGI